MTRDIDHLRDLLELVERAYFTDHTLLDGVTIKWARWRKRKKCFVYGTYDNETRTIEIHPALAAEHVPEYVLTSIIHHELLHAVFGMEHTEAFRRAEVMTPLFVPSEIWCSENFKALIAARPPKAGTT